METSTYSILSMKKVLNSFHFKLWTDTKRLNCQVNLSCSQHSFTKNESGIFIRFTKTLLSYLFICYFVYFLLFFLSIWFYWLENGCKFSNCFSWKHVMSSSHYWCERIYNNLNLCLRPQCATMNLNKKVQYQAKDYRSIKGQVKGAPLFKCSKLPWIKIRLIRSFCYAMKKLHTNVMNLKPIFEKFT